MKNLDKWKPKRFITDSKGKIKGTYNQKIIGYAYLPLIKKYASGVLADIGCGDVPFYNFYKNQISNNVCIDWGNSSLELSFLDYNADLNLPLDFLDENLFDTILLTDVLEHIKEPSILFSELQRIIKKDGYLIIGVPFLYWIHGTPHDYHRYTKYKLIDFCESNNFEVIEIKAYGGLPEIIFDNIYKGYNFLNLPFKKLILSLFYYFGLIISKTSFVKKISYRTSEVFPMGYTLVAKSK